MVDGHKLKSPPLEGVQTGIFEMIAYTINRSGQIRLRLNDRKRDAPARAFEQVSKTCKQFFGKVDIDRLRNQAKKLIPNNPLTDWLLAGRKETLRLREEAFKKYGRMTLWLLPKYEMLLYLHRRRRARKGLHNAPHTRAFTRVETYSLFTLFTLFIIVSGITVANAIAPTSVRSVVIDLETAANDTPILKGVVGPVNWLTGDATLKGSRKAVLGAHNYAVEADYSFAATGADVTRLVADGTLVKIEGAYITLDDVTYPYALPVAVRFLNRLGQQYAEHGCGKLVATSGVRPLDFQGTLQNGSRHSVHPTGMSFDLRRPIDEGSFCSVWLKDTLLEIEASRRIDVTAENDPRHYHVVVVPHVYEKWLATKAKELDPELKWLATGIYFEAAQNESMDGYRAIGWTIRNRKQSGDYPDTIVEVIAEGSAGKSNGGCQFSFMCDGKQENIYEPCKTPNPIMTQYWRNRCGERWEVVVDIARRILAEPESADPTNGAVLYYASSMSYKPHWAQPKIRMHMRNDGSKYPVLYPNGDFRTGTIQVLGSHRFGCSNFRGSRVCRISGDRS